MTLSAFLYELRPFLLRVFFFQYPNGTYSRALHPHAVLLFNPFPKQHILNPSKQREFADDNFKFDTNGRKVSKWVENTAGKRRNCS